MNNTIVDIKNPPVIDLNVLKSNPNQLEPALNPSDSFFTMLSEKTGNIFVISDPNGRLQYLNSSIPFGFDILDLSGKSINDLYDPKMTKHIFKGIRRVTLSGAHITNETYIIVQGKKVWFFNQMGPIRDTCGQIVAVGILGINITGRKEAENRVKNLIFRDQTTGLFNRAYLEDQLEKIEKNHQLPFCIVIGDINGLKYINDTLGHKTGDHLLRRAARLLKDSCGTEGIVARSGGDEFAILMPNSDLQNAEAICHKINQKFQRVASKPLPFSIALGYAIKDSPSKSVQEVFKEAAARMYRSKLLEQKSSYGSLISSLQNTLYEKSPETEEHAQRIKGLALKMGRALKLPPHELDNLDLLAILHDIGKIAIPEEILFKPGPLTHNEFQVMQTHSEIGARIARTNTHLDQVADGILAHHERWDGTGYPRGLMGTEIPLISRIIAITDSYDAMTHNRVYRRAIDASIALQEIQKGSGTQFDPELVETFLELFFKDFYQI